MTAPSKDYWGLKGINYAASGVLKEKVSPFIPFLKSPVPSEKTPVPLRSCQDIGWTEAFPTKHETAQTMTKKLLEDILPRYGFPVKIGSDNGPGFVSKIAKDSGLKRKVLKMYEILFG
ncbi:unnamed protein product [Nyctereutes procyonoides]|uniref:(raccoon dog) hypothetical protein n=1 Tax=Nyctereutes procyonoides TaxID=34880 RepID=A0A811ZYS4_NYCPR|nr:unnamed protein product [Nyctereutes procyonoides]